MLKPSDLFKRPKEYPKKPVKITQKYPEEMNSLCPLCENQVEFKYNSAERTVFTLEGPLAIRRHLFCCTNPKCMLNEIPFNPSLRFDYSQRLYGRDVLAKIGEYLIDEKSNPRQIYGILKREYGLPISESTVARMSNDILVLTSFHIDENTKNNLLEQEFLLVALDGQEPDGERPALWNFVDIISGRVLITRYLECADHLILHECIENIKEIYNKPIIGFISDKQGSIKTCLETFYAEIPHQYCTYHFSTNLWNHLEKYANKIHRKIQSAVKGLYIHKVSKKTKISIETEEIPVSLRTLCMPLDKELLSTLKSSNKKFECLKGITSFENMRDYLKGFKAAVMKIPIEDRLSKILKKSIKILEKTIKNIQEQYHNSKEGLDMFKSVHKLLWKEEINRENKIEALDILFENIWKKSQELNPLFAKTDRKSFLPTSKTPYWKFLAEWTRLWDSYKPGLFKYYNFPKEVKSNVDMEQRFGTEKQDLRSKSGRAHVGQMIESRGEYILRLQYCSPSDIDFEKIIAHSDEHLSILREEIESKIKKSLRRCTFSADSSKSYLQLLIRVYGLDMT